MSDVKTTVEQLLSANEQFQIAVKTGQTELATKIGGELLELKGQIKAVETALARSAVAEVSAETKAQNDHSKAFKSYVRSGNDAELRTVQGIVGTPADGGYAVPTIIDTNVTRLLVETSDVRAIAKKVTIGTSQYTHNISQANAAGGWVAETGTRSKTNSPTLGQVTITPSELYALPETSLQLIEDANFDIEGWYSNEVADILGRTESTAFVTGSGSGQPKGWLSYTTNSLGTTLVANGTPADYTKLNTLTSSTVQAVTYDDLNGMVYGLKPGYRKNACWTMSREVLQKVMGIKDSAGRPVWIPAAAAGMTAGAPDLLFGYPVYEFADMPSTLVGTGSPPAPVLAITFGDFSKGYTVVDRVGMSVIRDNITNKGFVSFYTRKRVGGGIEDGTALITLSVKQS